METSHLILQIYQISLMTILLMLQNVCQNIPRTPKSALDYLKNKNANSIFLTPVTHMEIDNII